MNGETPGTTDGNPSFGPVQPDKGLIMAEALATQNGESGVSGAGLSLPFIRRQATLGTVHDTQGYYPAGSTFKMKSCP